MPIGKELRKNDFAFLKVEPFMLRYRSMNGPARPSIPQGERFFPQPVKLFLPNS